MPNALESWGFAWDLEQRYDGIPRPPPQPPQPPAAPLLPHLPYQAPILEEALGVCVLLVCVLLCACALRLPGVRDGMDELSECGACAAFQPRGRAFGVAWTAIFFSSAVAILAQASGLALDARGLAVGANASAGLAWLLCAAWTLVVASVENGRAAAAARVALLTSACAAALGAAALVWDWDRGCGWPWTWGGALSAGTRAATKFAFSSFAGWLLLAAMLQARSALWTFEARDFARYTDTLAPLLLCVFVVCWSAAFVDLVIPLPLALALSMPGTGDVRGGEAWTRVALVVVALGASAVSIARDLSLPKTECL
jgi:hypothetical protein